MPPNNNKIEYVAFLGDSSELARNCYNALLYARFTIVPTTAIQIDLGVSVLYHSLIKEPILSKPRLGWINFHPAPLPEFRGFAPYTFGILEDRKEWGVTCHFITEKIDAGDIIASITFPIDHTTVTAYSLKEQSHKYTLLLFYKVLSLLSKSEHIPRTPQGKGRVFTRKDFELARHITPSESKESIDRKKRAFYCPPHEGVIWD